MSKLTSKCLLALTISSLTLVGCGEGGSSSKDDSADSRPVNNEPGKIEQEFEGFSSAEVDLVGGVDPDAKMSYKIVNGLGITEGDVVVGSHEELSRAGQVDAFGYPQEKAEPPVIDLRDPEKADEVKFSAWGGFRKWTNGVVPYQFGIAVSSEKQKMLRNALDEIEAVADVKFVERRYESNYLNIIDDGGCYSYLGMNGGKQDLSLSPGCWVNGIIIHEFMHALGFYHEQSRADRDSYIRLAWENISGGRNNGNFKRQGAVTTTLGSYDYGSVMHYGAWAFSINRKQTIIPLRSGVEIGQRKGLSDGDIAALKKAYGDVTSTGTGTGTGTGTTDTNEAPRVTLQYSGVSMWNDRFTKVPVRIYDDNDDISQLRITVATKDISVVKGVRELSKDPYQKDLFYLHVQSNNPSSDYKKPARTDLVLYVEDTKGKKTIKEFPVWVYNISHFGYSSGDNSVALQSDIDGSCLTGNSDQVTLSSCEGESGFTFAEQGLVSFAGNDELCLAASSLNEDAEVSLKTCDAADNTQQFQLVAGKLTSIAAPELSVSNDSGVARLQLTSDTSKDMLWSVKK